MKTIKLFNLTAILFVLIALLSYSNKEPKAQQYQIIKSLINQLHSDTEQNLVILNTNKRQFYQTVDSLGDNGKVLQKIKEQIREVDDKYSNFNNHYNYLFKEFDGVVTHLKTNSNIYKVNQKIDSLIIKNSSENLPKHSYDNFINSSYILIKAIHKSINNNCVMDDEWLLTELQNDFGFNHTQNSPSTLFLSKIKNSTSKIETLVALMIIRNQIVKQISLNYKYCLQTCALNYKVELNKKVNK